MVDPILGGRAPVAPPGSATDHHHHHHHHHNNYRHQIIMIMIMIMIIIIIIVIRSSSLSSTHHHHHHYQIIIIDIITFNLPGPLYTSAGAASVGWQGEIAPPPPCFFFCLSPQSGTVMMIIPLPHYGKNFRSDKIMCRSPPPLPPPHPR